MMISRAKDANPPVSGTFFLDPISCIFFPPRAPEYSNFVNSSGGPSCFGFFFKLSSLPLAVWDLFTELLSRLRAGHPCAGFQSSDYPPLGALLRQMTRSPESNPPSTDNDHFWPCVGSNSTAFCINIGCAQRTEMFKCRGFRSLCRVRCIAGTAGENPVQVFTAITCVLFGNGEKRVTSETDEILWFESFGSPCRKSWQMQGEPPGIS